MSERYLAHHGILGMKWGKKNGPPYPLDDEDHSAGERKSGWKKSLDKDKKRKIGKAAAIAGVAAIGAVSLYALYRRDQNNYQSAKDILDAINSTRGRDKRSEDYTNLTKAAEGISKRYKKRYDIDQMLDQGVADKRHRMYEGLYNRGVKKQIKTAIRNEKRAARQAKVDSITAPIRNVAGKVKRAYSVTKSTAQKVAGAARKTKRGVDNFVNRRVRKQPAGRLARYTVSDRRDYLE